MNAPQLAWGIAATGRIANTFAADLALVPGAALAAVGSRTAASADEFGDRFGIPRRHASYEALAADDAIDIVYVASPHTSHCRDTLLFIEAGKHVLCEKPLAVNTGEAAAMVEAAQRRKVFLMEGIWSRFLPAYRVLRETLAGGAIGTPELVEAEFGFAVPFDPTHRLLDPALGGGSLLDLGIYPLQLATLVLGPVAGVVAAAHVGATGVDESLYAIVTHEAGGHAVAKATVRFGLAGRALITGPRGTIELAPAMHHPPRLTVTVDGRATVIETPNQGQGLWYEAAEVQRCVAAGEQESPLLPWAESLRLAALMDEIRGQVGVRYANDEDS